MVPIQPADPDGVRHALCHPVQLAGGENATGEEAEGSGGED